MTTLLDEPCFVYHCWVGTECVYVGASNDPTLRLEQHKTQAPWAHEVDRIETFPFATGREALAVEAADIQRLRPRWNIAGRGPRSSWQLSDYVEVLMAVCAKRPVKTGYAGECADKRIARLVAELRWRYPDVAPTILDDLESTLTEAAA